MKSLKALAIVSLLVLISPAFAQVRIIQADVPFDFIVGNRTMPAGEYSLALNGSGSLRVSKTSGNEITGITAVQVAGSVDATPRLLFHRYGDRHYLVEVWMGEMSMSHRLFTSPAELESAKITKQETATILARK